MTFTVEGRRVVVVGAARSGVAAAGLIASRGGQVTLTDTRQAIDGADRLRSAGIRLELAGHRPETLAAADLIVLSPGVPPRQPVFDEARRRGVPIIAEIELAARWLRGRLVAITGTKGKSTTTVLAGRMLEAAGVQVFVGGNIGVALSAQVDASTPEAVHVVEVSSFQLEMVETFHPWIAVLLNLSSDHFDRHAGAEDYAAAKARIFANQDVRDWSVVNADDPVTLALARRGRARSLRFAVDAPLDEGVVVSGGAIVRRTAGVDTPLVPLSAVRVPGRHLLADVLAAAAVATLAGAPPEAITQAVGAFTGLEHALEPVAEIAGVRFVNDSKATNVEAARRSIEAFGPGLVPILGGRFKGGDLAPLRDALAGRARDVVTIGAARSLMAAALAGTTAVHEAASMDEAVRLAAGLAPPGGVVLLAPACASLDMFDDYAARGRAFRQAVSRLAGERQGTREQ